VVAVRCLWAVCAGLREGICIGQDLGCEEVERAQGTRTKGEWRDEIVDGADDENNRPRAKAARL